MVRNSSTRLNEGTQGPAVFWNDVYDGVVELLLVDVSTHLCDFGLSP